MRDALGENPIKESSEERSAEMASRETSPNTFAILQQVRIQTGMWWCGHVPKSDMTTVRVYVTLKPSLLDSAGRTVAQSLGKLGYSELQEARIGKLIELKLETYDEARVKEMCSKLLANPVIEDYRIEVAP